MKNIELGQTFMKALEEFDEVRTKWLQSESLEESVKLEEELNRKALRVANFTAAAAGLKVG